MTKPSLRVQNKIWFASFLLSAILVIGWLLFRQKRRIARSEEPIKNWITATELRLEGLTEAQAAARLAPIDLDAAREQENKDFKRQAIRQNLLTTFNIDLFVIAIIMLLLDSPWSTFGTLVVLALNVSINVFQEVFTKNMLDQILNEIRPQSTVIRERVIRSINPAQVVKGDLLVVRAGDQILLEGELVGSGEITVEEQTSQDSTRRILKKAGDKVYSGGYCVAGRAVYQVDEPGSEKYVTPPGRELQLLFSEMTPLERMMETVLRLLFGLAIFFVVFLLVEAFIIDVDLISSEFRNAISLIFGIAPTSLFFILILQYATGTRRLSRYGALVYKSTTIEKLSNVSVLCLSKSSLISGMQVVMTPLPPPPDQESLTENLIRQILGDIAHSVPISTRMESMIADAMPGTPRKILEIVPHSDVRGWFAVTFDEPDLRGTYVIGDPVALEPYLDLGKPVIVQKAKKTVTQTQQGLRRLLRRFNPQDEDENNDIGEGQITSDGGDPSDQDPVKPAASAPQAVPNRQIPAWSRRLLVSLDKLLTPLEERGLPDPSVENVPAVRKTLFAYLPAPVPIRDSNGQPMLPNGLISLADLSISDVIRPEAQATIRKLTDAGVDIKIMSTEAPERLLQTAKDLGVKMQADGAVSGSSLDDVDSVELSQTITDNSVFGNISPSQQAQIVQNLREQGEYVAIIGNDPGDVPAMRQADVCLATKGGSQVALMQTDIVMLKDSIEALPSVLVTGQRLVNSVLDTFKLYLSQVLSQILMILVVLVFNRGVFPYTSSQGGIISVFTITIPNIVLSAWSAAGRLSGEEIRRRLAFFVIPIGFTLPILSFVVLITFLNRTPPQEFSTLVTNLFNIDDVSLFYAQLAVTYALLFAGWLRLFFLQPPSKLWVGGAPLRGDRRVVGMVIFTIIVFVLFFSIPIFQELLKMTWLPYLSDFFLVTLYALIWALVVRVVWKLGMVEPIVNRFAHMRWISGRKSILQENPSNHSGIP